MTAWDISTLSFVQTRAITEESLPQKVFFKPDGSKMFVVGRDDEVNEYTLGTNWDISSETHVDAFSLTQGETAAGGMYFNTDGTLMYILDTATHIIWEYALDSWDVSTAVYNNHTFNTTTQTNQARGLWIRADGNKLYVVDSDATGKVYQYSLGTSWDISSASYDNKSFDYTGEESTANGIWLHPDGYQMFLIGHGNDKIYDYALGTQWDVSTAGITQDAALAAGVPRGPFFKPDGTKLYITQENTDLIYEYDMEAAVGTNTQINIGDAWKEISGIQINIGDAWKAVAGMQVNIGDSWKEVS